MQENDRKQKSDKRRTLKSILFENELPSLVEAYAKEHETNGSEAIHKLLRQALKGPVPVPMHAGRVR